MTMHRLKKRITSSAGAAAIVSVAVLSWSPNTVGAESVTAVSWGGSYGRACTKAIHEPFTAETGIEVRMEDYNGGLAQIRAQVETGNVHWDVVDLEMADAVLGCDEGLLEPIDASDLPPGPDGTSAEEDFFPETLTECGVGVVYYSTIYAYNEEKFSGPKPATIGDFFDLEKFPGRRGMRRTPVVNLEFALMADGVPVKQVYATLDTPEGVDRAFRKLDTIKEQIIWWEAGAQPPQMLGGRRGGHEHGLQRPHIQCPGPGETTVRRGLGRPGAGLGTDVHRGGNPEPGGGEEVRRLRSQDRRHGRHRPLHLLQSGPAFRHRTHFDAPGDRGGHEATHAHDPR